MSKWRTVVALTSAQGLDVGAGALPTARKLGATIKGSAGKLEDAQRVTAVLELKLTDHDGRREAIRTFQPALVQKSALEGSYASADQSAEKTVLLHPNRLCLLKHAWYLVARSDGSNHHPGASPGGRLQPQRETFPTRSPAIRP